MKPKILITKLAKRLPIFVVATMVPVTLLAQETQLEEVVVTATPGQKALNAIPNSVRIIDQQMLADQLKISTSLLDSLSFSIPSMAPGREKLTSDAVTLRGRTPLYLVDGVPQSTPLRNGKRSGYTLDPDFIDRVEIIYGANAIQGVGATGGIINTVTVSAPDDGDWLRKVKFGLVTDNVESNGYHYKTSALAGKKNDATDFIAGVALEQRDLYYDGDGNPVAVGPIQGDTMDSKSFNVFGKWGFDFSDTRRLEVLTSLFKLEGDGDYQRSPGDMDQNIPATSIKGSEPGDPPENDAKNVSASYTDSNFASGSLMVKAYYYDLYALYGGGTFGAFQDASVAPEGELFDQSALNSEKYGIKLTYLKNDVFWDGFQVVAGLDYLYDETYQDLVQTGRIWVPKMQFEGWAPYLQLEQAFQGDKLLISAGIRQENVTLNVPSFTTVASAGNTLVEGSSPNFSELLVNAGVVYSVNDALTLYSSYSEGFNMPDAGLLLRAVNTPDQSVDDLVDLQPILADNAELGLNYRLNRLTLSASYFESNSDLGGRIQVIDGIGFVSREKTEVNGFELSASYTTDQELEFGANYAKLNGQYDSNDDGQVDRDLDGRNISPDRLNFWLQSPIADGFFARVQYSHLFDRNFEGGLPENDFEGYQLVDFLLKYETPTLGEFSLGIQNLLAEQYLTYYSQTVTFVNPNTFVAGRGRTLHLNWSKSI